MKLLTLFGGYILKKSVFLLFFICSLTLFSFMKIEEHIFSESLEKRYNFSICAIFKNEARYLKEWIEYHLLFGVDHFYLYNIGSRDTFQITLKPYIEKGIVTLINWPEVLPYPGDFQAYRWALCTQIPAYENAVNFIAKTETKWLMFADIDEFLVCPEGNDIKELLKKYEDFSGLCLSSDCFDAEIHDIIPKNKLIIQTLDRTHPPKPIVNKTVAKMIFKPDHCTGFIWPPYQCRFQQQDSDIKVDRKEIRINRYINRNSSSSPSTLTKYRIDIDNRFMTEEDISVLLEAGFVIEDKERPIYQLLPELLKKMHFNVK